MRRLDRAIMPSGRLRQSARNRDRLGRFARTAQCWMSLAIRRRCRRSQCGVGCSRSGLLSFDCSSGAAQPPKINSKRVIEHKIIRVLFIFPTVLYFANFDVIILLISV